MSMLLFSDCPVTNTKSNVSLVEPVPATYVWYTYKHIPRRERFTIFDVELNVLARTLVSIETRVPNDRWTCSMCILNSTHLGQSGHPYCSFDNSGPCVTSLFATVQIRGILINLNNSMESHSRRISITCKGGKSV